MKTITAYDNPLLNKAIGKVWVRLMPLLFILYFVAFIDRVNIGFAKDAMQADIHLSDGAYALGAGIFFCAYALFGVPANLILNRIGARLWISLTTVIWGVLSMATGFITNEFEFIVIRFLLGIAEAGFYPGILLMASIFFPDKVRGAVIGAFVLAVPFALALGSPISGALLELHGFLGHAGWTWMFVLEGLPAVFIGIFCYFYLDDTPDKAKFLQSEERAILAETIAIEGKQQQVSRVADAIRSPAVWHLALMYGFLQVGVYGMLFFMPSQVAALMGTTIGFKASLVAAIPYAAAVFGVYYIPRYTDSFPHLRIPVAAFIVILAAVGLTLSAFASAPVAIVALSFSAVGFLAVQPIFWTFPPQVLSGAALAAGIGFCTMLGAVGSFLAPIIRVEAESMFANKSAGLVVLSLCTIVCAALIVTFSARKQKKYEVKNVAP
ncbi:MFS transporter [Bartonella sp. LJL80]